MVARGRRRVGGQQIRPRSIASGVRCAGMPLWFRPSSRCFSSRCTPSRQRLSTRRKKLPAGGVPARHRWFWKRRNGDYKGAIERSTYSEAVKTFWRSFRIGSARRTPKPGQWQPKRSATIFARTRTSGLFCRKPGSGENNPLSRQTGSVPKLISDEKTLYRNRNKQSLLQDRAGHSTQLRKVPNVVATKNG